MRPMRRATASILFAIAMCAHGHARAEECNRGLDKFLNEFQFILDNDLLAKTDRYYTTGVKFGGSVELCGVPSLLSAPGRFLLSWRDAVPSVGMFVGQNMYTPRDIQDPNPQPGDRPWAGWLYVGTVAQVVHSNKKALDSVELDLGVVGSHALGREIQSFVHKYIADAPTPRGWSNQLPNEPAFLLAYLHKRKFGDTTFDVVPHVGVTVGTVMDLARAGATIRFGKNLSGFGPGRIEPGGAVLQNTRAHLEDRADYEFYGFAGVDGRAVAHNIFLDGTVFHSSASVDRKPFVYDFNLGVSARYKSFRFSLTRVRRSDEFTTPFGGGGRQTFYALTLAYERF